MIKEKYFDGLKDIIDFAKLGKKPKNAMYYKSDVDFYGCTSVIQAENYALYGWEAGVNKLDLKINQIKSAEYAIKTEYQYDVIGDVLDIGNYLAGLPECWIAEKQHQDKPHLELYIETAILSYITTDQVYNRGAAIVSLIDKLSETHNLNIWLVSGAESRSRENKMNIYVNMGNSPLDMNAITYGLCHPSFFRYFNIAVIDIEFKTTENLTAGTWHLYDDKLKEKEIYIPGVNDDNEHYFESISGSQEWMNKQIERILK